MECLGLRSVVRTALAAHWSSWADCVHTISERHACRPSRCSSVGGGRGLGPLVSPVRANGEPRGQCARQDGAAFAEAHRLKHRTYPEFSGFQSRARLVVLAAEVGGRWSEEARSFVSQLARAQVRSGLAVSLSCLASPHERLPCPCWIVVQLLGCDGDTPTVSDAVAACRHLPDLS